MFVFSLLLIIVILSLLLIVAALQPVGSELSIYELERRVETGDKDAKKALVREKMLDYVRSLQTASIALLLIVFTLLSVSTFGWLIGILIAILTALEYGAIARWNFLMNWSQKLYSGVEKKIFRFIKKAPWFFSLVRSTPQANRNVHQIGSREELQRLVSESGNILTADDKNLVINSLSFNNRLVSSIMTPRNMINSIKKSEFLGPLALNDLHKLGHSRLPVINSDIDHVVGILHLRNLLTLDTKRSTTAEKAMEPKVFYIHEDQTLQHALAAFLKTRHLLFIVVNKSRETVGLLTFEDVVEALIGHQIIDEFDAYDDLNKVSSL